MVKLTDIVGKEFLTKEGYVVKIVNYINDKDCDIQFNDARRTTLRNYRFSQVKNGQVKNPYHKSVYGVGFIGEGEYKSKINGIITKVYTLWKHVLRRCYLSEVDIKTYSYKDVTICEEWHNFQNFAEWIDKNYNSKVMEGWQLDKDILVKGNKIYSPETCAFVPQEINILFTKRYNSRGVYPIGVCFHTAHNKFSAIISKNGKQKHLGYYKTPEEAFQAYKSAKEKHIKEVADKWRGQITEEVYQAMHNYKVEKED